MVVLTRPTLEIRRAQKPVDSAGLAPKTRIATIDLLSLLCLLLVSSLLIFSPVRHLGQRDLAGFCKLVYNSSDYGIRIDPIHVCEKDLSKRRHEAVLGLELSAIVTRCTKSSSLVHRCQNLVDGHYLIRTRSCGSWDLR
jgi:hypothetical protein